jgi:hypothetical protein
MALDHGTRGTGTEKGKNTITGETVAGWVKPGIEEPYRTDQDQDIKFTTILSSQVMTLRSPSVSLQSLDSSPSVEHSADIRPGSGVKQSKAGLGHFLHTRFTMPPEKWSSL